MTRDESFRGVFALLLTPFLANREIDWPMYDRYVDWQLARQPHGLFAVCGSSEMGKLTMEERLKLAARAVSRAGNVPVLATANVEGDPSEHEQELLRMAQTGVSGVVLIPPNGLGRDQERLGDYFARMAELSPVPVFLYECPMVKPHLIDSRVYGELAVKHGIRGIKDTTCTLEGIEAKIKAAPGSIVYQANTPLMLEAIHRGAGGIMAITTTAAADLALELWRLGTARDPAASAVLERLIALDAILGSGFPATGKQLAAMQGIPLNPYTRSDKEATPETRQALEAWMASGG
ncbi:dihydrodipicolinate synthase family protein [Cohnella cellulosilytica]|uniref:Dihydrodipicolinate synthase family protein n=1 Tax=Cohnella cellulosilytica TaxID=986710 RepID=A0ABW2F4I0_9BACL